MGLPNQYSLYIQSVALLFYLQSTVCNGRVIIKTAMAMNTKPVCDVTVATSIFYRCLEHKKARLWCGVDCFIKRAPVPFVDTFSKSQEVMYVMLALNSPPIHSPPPTLSFQTILPKYHSRRLMCDLQTDFEGSSDFSTTSSMHTHFFVFYLLAADSCLLSRKQFMLLALSHRATLTVCLHV